MNVRRRINAFEDTTDSPHISQIITDIVCHALFHADTVLEFTSVLKDVKTDNKSSGNVKQTNYVVRLFETLENMVNSEDKDQILDGMCIVYVTEKRYLIFIR